MSAMCSKIGKYMAREDNINESEDQFIYVSLRLRVSNAVPTQPCVGKLGISLVLLNFLHCNFRYGLKLHKLSIHTLIMLQ